jgi:adenine-specific DNA-methyltransferase
VYRKSDEYNINLIPDNDSRGFTKFDDIDGFKLRELRNRNIKFSKKNRQNLNYPYINSNNPDDNTLYKISLGKCNSWIELYPIASQIYILFGIGVNLSGKKI